MDNIDYTNLSKCIIYYLSPANYYNVYDNS